jgi:hypothetical protein
MSVAAPWEVFLADHFPGYLLPEAYRRALPEDVAAHFLERIGGSPRQLSLVRSASVIAARCDDIGELALTQLPDLARRLPRRTEVERRARHGELRGRLDAAVTMQRRMTGRLTEIVARAPRAQSPLPEDVLLGAVAARLVTILRELRAAGVIGRTGWGAAVAPCAGAITRALAGTALADPAGEPVTARHEEAARAASHPAYRLALTLHHALREGLDARSPELVARSVAAGALLPLADHTRFELAVLLRLIQALARRPRWTLRRTLVVPGRREVAELEGEGGARIRIHYDQACLDPGPYDAGLRRYLGQRGRLRPDITVVASAPGVTPRATVIEAKLSEDPGYLAQGYREAIVYRAEYGGALTGWPKAILVTAAPIAAEPCREDEVIAVGWDRWVPESVVEALLEEMSGSDGR